MELFNQLNKEFSNIEQVRNKLFNPQLIQLHPNIVGFNSPTTYGVYKNTGGNALGIVGKNYKPMDLNIMLDSIVTSVMECNNGINLSTLKFKEYYDGAKVAFTIDLPTKVLKNSAMVGDIVDRKLEFRTGFDGKTKSSITESYKRLWCENGCTNTKSQNVSFKNTINNHAKIYNLCNYINRAVENSDSFITNLDKLNDIKISQNEIDTFLTKVTGYNVKDYKDLTTRKRNILDSINSSIAIEIQNTGDNFFSLVNGITRYTTHDKAKGSEEALFYGSSATLNNNALKVAFESLS